MRISDWSSDVFSSDLEKEGLELLPHAPRGLGCPAGSGLGAGLSVGLQAGEGSGGAAGDGGVGHGQSTSISACRAPAALMACRMEIMSRGPMPKIGRAHV